MRVLFTVAVAALLVAGGAVAWWWLDGPGAGPLQGERFHDFGAMPILGRSVTAEHTFILTNESAETLVVDQVRPSCGCTTVIVEPMSVAPGAAMRITTALTLTHAGEKAAHVTLVLNPPFEPVLLGVSGDGVPTKRLLAPQRVARLSRATSTEVALLMEDYESDDAPPTPDLTITPPLVARIGPWGREEERHGAAPARWRAVVTIEPAGPSFAGGGELTARLDEHRVVTTHLTDPPDPSTLPDDATPD